jgi:hypothetical protein
MALGADYVTSSQKTEIVRGPCAEGPFVFVFGGRFLFIGTEISAFSYVQRYAVPDMPSHR